MYDNKIRLSQDVLDKAALIANEWGLKNPRAAVEAVFRKYADEYLNGPRRSANGNTSIPSIALSQSPSPISKDCEALNELDDLLSL